MKSRNAFTLIELLVVIAIISLLVSILLPSLKRAQDLAKDTLCKANFKGIGLACAIYSSEYDDMIVPTGVLGNPGGIAQYWLRALLLFHGGYAESPGMFQCPRFGDNMPRPEFRVEDYPWWDIENGMLWLEKKDDAVMTITAAAHDFWAFGAVPRIGMMGDVMPDQKMMWDSQVFWNFYGRGYHGMDGWASGYPVYTVLFADQSVHLMDGFYAPNMPAPYDTEGEILD